MNPPSDMKKTDLTTEERALAQRLARLGPHGEPSPALDARILAAAHDAAARHGGTRPQRRWPVAFGIAASLALAVGIAWQLRPLPQTTAAYQSEAPAAASVPATPERAAVADSMTESATAPADATAAAQQSDAAPAISTPAPDASRESAKTMKSAAPPPPAEPMTEPDIVFDSPAPAAAEAAAQAVTTVEAPGAFSAQPPPAPPMASDKRRSAAAAADAAASTLPETDTLDRLQATGTTEAAASDEPGTDVPPATMTSPEARDAWLARIRELLAAGKPDAARASLREFKHRYPDDPLPDDLRALGQ
jgi:hypothetical protein